jgi:hypothetical protein
MLPASIIFSPEAPGVQETSVVGVTTETFDLLPTGRLSSYNSAIGTYSAGAAIAEPGAFGGANQTRYIATGSDSNSTEYELVFPGLRDFFGFYWAAGDPQNAVRFYEGTMLKQQFTIGHVVAGLPTEYFGNPNTGANTDQPYVYLNFTSTDLASRFDRVVFRNPGLNSSFESDNHSALSNTTAPIPEPSSWLLIVTGCGAFLALAARRRCAEHRAVLTDAHTSARAQCSPALSK